MGTPTLPSALLRFTSEFGMESGGATALLSLNKKVTILESLSQQRRYKSKVQVTRKYVIAIFIVFLSVFIQPSLFISKKLLGCCMVKPHGQLVSVSSRPHNPYTPDLSTL